MTSDRATKRRSWSPPRPVVVAHLLRFGRLLLRLLFLFRVRQAIQVEALVGGAHDEIPSVRRERLAQGLRRQFQPRDLLAVFRLEDGERVAVLGHA